MRGRSRLTWLILALISYSLWMALSANLASRHGTTVPVYSAAAMLFRAGVEADKTSAMPEDKAAVCAHCPPLKREFTLAVAEGLQRRDGKAFVAPDEENPPKSKD
jgi:hypothetical protein